uniref:Carboxylesterase type B domain-containing protein n=1 Tax=Timema genevievae TaxID=629358 RepID=A0A7R9PLT8_TIMGE|nr:unnamed protein product [Timema genevievae]
MFFPIAGRAIFPSPILSHLTTLRMRITQLVLRVEQTQCWSGDGLSQGYGVIEGDGLYQLSVLLQVMACIRGMVLLKVMVMACIMGYGVIAGDGLYQLSLLLQVMACISCVLLQVYGLSQGYGVISGYGLYQWSVLLQVMACLRGMVLFQVMACICDGLYQLSVLLQVMACLRAVPSGRLDQLSWQVPQLWRPVVDGMLITTDPLRAIRRAAYDRGVQIMIGETGGEGSICLLQHYYLETVFSRAILADNVTKREFVQLVQEHVYDYLKDPSVIEAAVHEYRPWPDSNASFRDQFLHFCGALYTRVKSEQLARWLARRGTTVWRYEFSYRPQCSPHPRFMGPAHGDEVLFVFGLLEEEATGQETQLEQRVLTSWANFAKTG